MNFRTERNLALTVCLIWGGWIIAPISVVARPGVMSLPGRVADASLRQNQPAAQSQTVKPVGTIKSITESTIVLTSDAGDVTKVEAQESARVLQISPGQKDLKGATPIHLQDLQTGDRILVFGKTADGGKSVSATIIVVMKSSDVEAKRQQEGQEWQHGVGGLVEAVDPTAGIVTVSIAAPGGSRTISVQAGKKAIVRRYAPDSVKFSDAKLSTMGQIKPGDQLRARGKLADGGAEFNAIEIVFGSFRNIAGTIVSVGASGPTLQIMDLATKKPVLVKISSDSQLRILPAEIAQRIAMRLKSSAGAKPIASPTFTGANSPTTGQTSSPAQTRATGNSGPEAGSGPGSALNRGARQNGPMDLQQILSHMPSSPIADFHKGDAVMIVSTEGLAPGEVTAITILGGVEPLLTASPGGGQATTLSPWNLGSSTNEGDSGAP